MSRRAFVETCFLLALVNRQDPADDRCKEVYKSFHGRFVIFEWILLEFADAMCYSEYARSICLERRLTILSLSNFVVVPFDSLTYSDALDLYERYRDKQWSLTDCTSFVIMKDQELSEALTADHHFT